MAAASMRLAGAARPEDQDVGALLDPGVAAGERRQMRLAQARGGGEVEGRASVLPAGRPDWARWRAMRRARPLGEFVLA